METAVGDKRKTNLGDELALKLGAVILRCMGPQGGEVLRVIDESGLTFAQMKSLVELQAPDEEHTVSSLAERIGISVASASRAADGMVRKKLVTRVEDPNDRRVKRLTLTAKGRQLADRIIGEEQAAAGKLRGLFPEAARLSLRDVGVTG